MLLWEALTRPRTNPTRTTGIDPTAIVPQRLPYDRRCATLTKSGKRCRGKVKTGSEFCPLHNPAVAESRRLRTLTPQARARRRLMHLPDGYLRKLTHRAAVGQAMDRLYRELRLGVVSIEMGRVLFDVLTRLLDSGLVESGKVAASVSRRSKADRFRTKLADLLTLGERRAWRRAVAHAPNSVLQAHELATASSSVRVATPCPATGEADAPFAHVLQAAS